MAWRIVRQVSTNQWLGVFHSAGTPEHLGDDDAYRVDVGQGFGIAPEDLEVHRGAGDEAGILGALRRGGVPSLPAGVPACVGVIPAPEASDDPATTNKKAARAALETAVADPSVPKPVRDALAALKALV